MACSNCCKSLFRRKPLDMSTIGETKLSRVLNALDLTALGIGCTLGSGIYVLAGQVAKEIAGPGVIISFLIAAIASVLAGLCYAEFGARVPKAGSAYVYSYVTVGELWAFIIGWNLILEYIIGAASVARGFTAYFDSLVHNQISQFFLRTMPLNITSLSPYPDFFAFVITLTLTLILAIGVKESTTLNNVFTLVNLAVVSYIIICGGVKADFKNWRIPESQLPSGNTTEFGDGGFLPFGSSGLLAGAATCFYAFVGFDAIATTGEEVQNPQRSIPIGIVLSLLFCFLAYFAVSAIITLMVPYYLLDPNAPLPLAFEKIGWPVAKYIISVGAICGLSTSLLGAMFPMPRVIYAMASDGLLFKFLSIVSERFKTPFIATIVSGTLAAVMAMFFDIQQLVEMMSIGTLLAYTLVAACVLILRYDCGDLSGKSTNQSRGDIELTRPPVCQLLFIPPYQEPTQWSAKVVKTTVFILVIKFAAVSAIQQCYIRYVGFSQFPAVVGLAVPLVSILVSLVIIIRQPQSNAYLPFKVPFVPLLPAASIFINIYLMLELSKLTWIRFAVWMAIGFLIYFGYGIRHSAEAPSNKQEDQQAIIDTDNVNSTA